MNTIKKAVIGGLVAIAAATASAQETKPYTPDGTWVLGTITSKTIFNPSYIVSEKKYPRTIASGEDVAATVLVYSKKVRLGILEPSRDHTLRANVIYAGNDGEKASFTLTCILNPHLQTGYATTYNQNVKIGDERTLGLSCPLVEEGMTPQRLRIKVNSINERDDATIDVKVIVDVEKR